MDGDSSTSAAIDMASKRTVLLVLGGVRSGKSRYAQDYASRFARVAFIATATRSDAEMRRRIAAHRRERPRDWKTVEAPRHLDRVIRREGGAANLLLVDCLTTYCGGLLSVRGVSQAQRDHLASVVDAIRSTPASIVLVSNEVGSGVVPAFKSGRLYRDLLGELNQQVARVATDVVLLVAGLPLVLKGRR
jgi:adenosylcobinamide kinase/adenosylcobinamide-phosphate guanylyltransferase